MSAKQETSDLRVEISPDRLTARLLADSSALTRSWDADELQQLCEAAGLAITPELKQELAALEDPKKRGGKADSFEIARGTPPTDATPASIVYTVAGGCVRKDSVIARIAPPQAGNDGLDVLGAPIPHTAAQDAALVCPAMTRREGDSIIANTDCYLRVDGKIGKTEPISFLNRIDSSDQLVTFEQSVCVRGNVHKGVPIHAKRSLIVDGSIDAAVITAAGDLRVGGIFGRAMGRIVVGRNLYARFIKQAHVIVNGDVHIEEELYEADLTCLGQLLAPEGDIKGGRVHAEGGMEVRSIGSDSLIRTTIEIGLDVTFDKLIETKKNAILHGRRHIEQVRMHVKPLMANPKRLTNAQKEKATELLFQADELQTAIDGHLGALRTAMDVMRKRAESSLIVRSAVHPGTTIRFQGVETTIRSAINGPCRIVAQGVGEKPRIVAFLGTNPTPQLLESRLIPQNPFAEMKKLAARAV